MPSPPPPSLSVQARPRMKALPLRMLENRHKLAITFQCLKKLYTLTESVGLQSRVTLKPEMHENGRRNRSRVRVQLLSTLRTAHPFSRPEKRPYSYSCIAARSLPRVHYRLGCDVSTHVSKHYIRGGSFYGHRNLICNRRGIVMSEKNCIRGIFIQERTSLAGK